MEGDSPTPLRSVLWAVDKARAATPYVARNVLESHLKDESRRQAAYRPMRWVVAMPLNCEIPKLNLELITEFYRGEQIARGSMLRKKDAVPDAVEIQLSLW